MFIKVAYFGRTAKVNCVIIDTENKRIYNDRIAITKDYAFVEAKLSKDVDNLRAKLIKDGYREVIA